MFFYRNFFRTSNRAGAHLGLARPGPKGRQIFESPGPSRVFGLCRKRSPGPARFFGLGAMCTMRGGVVLPNDMPVPTCLCHSTTPLPPPTQMGMLPGPGPGLVTRTWILLSEWPCLSTIFLHQIITSRLFAIKLSPTYPHIHHHPITRNPVVAVSCCVMLLLLATMPAAVVGLLVQFSSSTDVHVA